MRTSHIIRRVAGLPWPRRRPPGRILAVKWGLNPNSSSLGVDVTFLLFGAAALSMATPVLGALLRLRRPAADPHLAAHETPPAQSD